MATSNQNAEQRARDQIDAKLAEAGWIVQHRTAINFQAGSGIAVREYQTDVGPADYVLFLNKQAVGVIEAKPEEWGHKITTVEDQSAGYATAKLKWVSNKEPLPFVYESTGVMSAPLYSHVGIWVDDIKETIAALRKRGVKVEDARTGNSKAPLTNITDPNGIRLELLEFAPDSLQKKAIDSWR